MQRLNLGLEAPSVLGEGGASLLEFGNRTLKGALKRDGQGFYELVEGH